MKISKLFNLKSLIMLMFLFTLTLSVPVNVMGQPKITSLTEVEEKVKDSSTSIGNMAKYIIGAVLLIALIGVIYMVASSHPKSKEAVIGWIVAIVVYIIAISIV
jgi:uncharacterized BrkB/YihY/UPF0761 family membrane protein